MKKRYIFKVLGFDENSYESKELRDGIEIDDETERIHSIHFQSNVNSTYRREEMSDGRLSTNYHDYDVLVVIEQDIE